MGKHITLPSDKAVERIILTCMMNSIEAVNLCMEKLEVIDFCYSEHQIIFAAIKEIFKLDRPISLSAITHMLRADGTLEKAGGLDYVCGLCSYESGTDLPYFIESLKDKTLLRRLLVIFNEMMSHCLNGALSGTDILDLAIKALFSLSNSSMEGSHHNLKDLLAGGDGKSFIDKLKETCENYKKGIPNYRGYKTHFIDLDKKISGLNAGHLTIIGARPGVGKTTFLANLVENMAFENNIPVAIFSLEMPNDELLFKLLSQKSGVPANDIKKGSINDKAYKEIVLAAEKYAEKTIVLDDRAGPTFSHLRARCQRLKQVYDVKIVFIDYLQLIRWDTKLISKQFEIEEISRNLKCLAKDLNISIVCLAQLNRDIEKRESKKPQMSDLRDSGSLEQDADEIILLSRDTLDPHTELLILNIVKNRHGQTGSMRLLYDLPTGKMKNFNI